MKRLALKWMAKTGAKVSALVAIGLFGLWLVGRHMIVGAETVDTAELAPLPGAGFVTTRSGRVHVLDQGSGPTIILLHGSGRSLVDWQDGVADQLARNHRVIAFDFYGTGFSDRNPDFKYGYDLWVRQIADVMDALGVEHATIVGHSVGGALACIFATEYPNRTDAVVTIGTGMEIEPAQFLLALPGVGEIAFARQPLYGLTFTSVQKSALEAAFRVRGTRRALLEYMRRQMTIDGLRLVTGVFEDIQAPILHISGAMDTNISPEAAKALAIRTGGTFIAIEGASHYLPYEAPDALSQEIDLFLSPHIP